MSNCPHCGVPAAPGNRFCTECGKPIAMPGNVLPPVPPTGAIPQGRPPMPPTGMFPPAPPTGRPPMPPAPPVGGMIPPAPPMPAPPQHVMPPIVGTQVPPVPSIPPAPPAPPAQAVAHAAASLAAPAGSLFSIGEGEAFRAADAGDLFNDGNPVAVVVTCNKLIIAPANGVPKVEEISGIRQAVVGDFDGDGTQDLAIFTDTHVWVVRYGTFGSVPSGKVALQQVPGHLTRAPFTHDGRTVLMSTTAEKIAFCVLHPARGLVEIGSSDVPVIHS